MAIFMFSVWYFSFWLGGGGGGGGCVLLACFRVKTDGN